MIGLASNAIERWGHKNSWLNRFLWLQSKKLPNPFFVIDWGVGSANVSLYQYFDTELTSLANFQIDWDEKEPSSPKAIGDLLAQELKQRDILVRDAIVSVPRRFIVLKDLKLPKSIATDLSEAVLLQCENLFPVNRSTLTIDYIASPLTESDEDLSILIAAVPLNVTSQIIEALRSAHLRPIALGIAELGLPRLTYLDSKQKTKAGASANGSGDTAAWQIDLLFNESRSEFVLSHDRFPVISYGGQTPEAIDDRLRFFSSTIDRLSQAARLRDPAMSDPQVKVYGEIDSADINLLQNHCSQSLHFHNDWTFEQVRDRALIASLEDQRTAIDLGHPRKPIDIDARNRQWSVALAALVLLLCGLLSVPIFWNHSRLNRKLVEVANEKALLEARIERLQPIEKTWKKLVQFERSKIDMAIELRDMIGRLKPSQQMFITTLEINEIPSSGTTVMRLKGKVKDRDTFAALTDELLLASDRYRLRPPLLEPITGDELYLFSFIFELELKP